MYSDLLGYIGFIYAGSPRGMEFCRCQLGGSYEEYQLIESFDIATLAVL